MEGSMDYLNYGPQDDWEVGTEGKATKQMITTGDAGHAAHLIEAARQKTPKDGVERTVCLLDDGHENYVIIRPGGSERRFSTPMKGATSH